MPDPSPTLPQLRAEIAKQRSKAALIPGLPGLLTLVESLLVESDARIAALERVAFTRPADQARVASLADRVARLENVTPAARNLQSLVELTSHAKISSEVQS